MQAKVKKNLSVVEWKNQTDSLSPPSTLPTRTHKVLDSSKFIGTCIRV